jgi:hypothetical protein
MAKIRLEGTEEQIHIKPERNETELEREGKNKQKSRDKLEKKQKNRCQEKTARTGK